MVSAKTNFLLDLIGFLNLIALAATGFIIRYVLPRGSGGGRGRQFRGGYGGEENLKSLLSMTRHQWGDIHFILAVVFVVIMAIHIILHWEWIKKCGANIFRRSHCTE